MNILKRNQTLIPAIALAAVFALLGSTNVYAQKKPGGGGGGETTPVPAGTIHFQQETADFWYYADMTMKADGSAKTQLGISENGPGWEPSHQLHDGQRWFLSALDTDVEGKYGPKRELFAFTADGISVQLTNDPDVYVGNVRWAKNDSFLSFAGYEPATEDEGLYVADVDWSSGSPMIGPPRKVLSTLVAIDDFEVNYLGTYDWSPAGDELVYNDIRDGDRQEIRVIQFLADDSLETRNLGFGSGPEWSPDGSRIAFQNSDAAIWTMLPDGADAVKISSPKVNSFQHHIHPTWSPDSRHLAFTQITPKMVKGSFSGSSSWDVLRISATGGKATELTADTDTISWVIGWR